MPINNTDPDLGGPNIYRSCRSGTLVGTNDVAIDKIANLQDVWNALVQIRQKTKQRKTLFYVEQLLLKYGATKVLIYLLVTFLLLDAMRPVLQVEV